jgi:acetolactate synthase-1/2/3 large subunit
MRVADYIAIELAKIATNCYMVTGGGAMHLNDAFGKSDLNLVFCHHEQACAMAAEAEARLTNVPAVVNVTTGPGGINAINGVFGAYVDSIPMIVISGQVKRETLVRFNQSELRQLGDQEVDIIQMVKGVTKYAECILDPHSIRYHLEKAIFLANHGRSGPVWLDIPIDVQALDVKVETLDSFNSTLEIKEEFNGPNVLAGVEDLLERLKTSQRPVIYTGFGIWASNTQNQLLSIAEKFDIPVVTSFNSNDLISDNHKCYVGRGGTIGNRSGNFVLQSADLVLVLGSRLNIRQVSYNWKSFAPNAFKIGVDVDLLELTKPTCQFDLKIHADLNYFFSVLFDKNLESDIPQFTSWLEWSKTRLINYPVCLPEYWTLTETVNPYCFVDQLFADLNENETIVCADGTACVVTFQAMSVNKGQRVFHNSGCASMGYDLPAAIGAFYSRRSDRVICIAGDGSIMMNIQELQTISGNNLPIQIFILNNKGYHSIRQTQRNFFKDNIVGCGTDSGLSFPDFEKIASAFEFPFYRISNHEELKIQMPEILKDDGRFICEIMLDLNQHFSPKLSSKILADGSMVTSSLEDMWPFLSPDELSNNVIR